MSYMSLLPDEIFQLVYRNLLDECIKQTAFKCRLRQLHERAFTRAKQTNRAVVHHWLQSSPHRSMNMWTDGDRIYSYAMEIGHTTEDEVKVAKDHTHGPGIRIRHADDQYPHQPRKPIRRPC